jgi:homoserine kinase
MTDLIAAKVRVPCSTSNLGSGYDTIGLALDRYLEASFTPHSGGGIVLERTGTLSRLDETQEPDLVATFFERHLAQHDLTPSGTLRLHSEIPVARGLGASAAAVVAGHELAYAVRGVSGDNEETFTAAMQFEGHGDNVAPSVFGGLRAVATTPDGPVVMSLHLSNEVGFAYAAPAAGISTRMARELLPTQVSHGVAATSLGRLVALVRGLAEGNPELIRIGVHDQLHVPYRLPLIPGAVAAMSAATDAGAWAVTISGAGSGLLAMCEPSQADGVAAAMHEIFDAEVGDPECVGFSVRPCTNGVQRVP